MTEITELEAIQCYAAELHKSTNMRALSAVVLFFSLVAPLFGEAACQREIIVNVRDSKGNFVSDLQASSFHAKVAGHEAQVTSARLFAGSVRLLLMLDASGSMSGEREVKRWKAIKNFTEQIVASAPPSTKIAMVAFNTQITRKVDFDHSRRDLLAAVEQIPNTNGHTHLWNSLLETAEMFGHSEPGDAVLVISDFGDNAHQSNAAEVEKVFGDKGIRIFGIGIYDHYFSSEEERQGPDTFFDLVKRTGGDVIKDIGQYRDNEAGLLKRLCSETGTFYLLRITPSVPTSKPDRLNLSLVAQNGKKNKGVVLYYPQQFAPCLP